MWYYVELLVVVVGMYVGVVVDGDFCSGVVDFEVFGGGIVVGEIEVVVDGVKS